MRAREILKAFLESSHECLKFPGWAQWYSNVTICKGTLTSTGWYGYILAQITGSCVNNETSASKMVFNGYLEWFL